MRFYILFIIIPLFSFCQEDKFMIDAFFGLTEDGTGLVAKVNVPVFEKTEFQGSIYHSFTNEYYSNIKVPYRNVSLNLGASRLLFNSLNRKLSFKVGLGGLFGHEKLMDSEKFNNYLSSQLMTSKIESKFIYGAFANAQFNYILTHSFSLSILGNQFYHVNSNMGNFTPFAGLGITYHIY